MKVLLYEPGRVGHRPIYLRYISESFTEAGHAIFVVTGNYGKNPGSLAELARQHGCGVVFVCTLDGLFGWLVVLGLFCRFSGIRVSGIYYLFNNLYQGWKKYLWRGLLRFRLVDTIFVPDLMFEENFSATPSPGIRKIQDTWDSRELKRIPRGPALIDCGISDADSCVLLLLGAISRRKGIEKLLAVLKEWDFVARPKLKILVAGRIERDTADILELFRHENPLINRAVYVTDRWLNDEEICRCYAASSYLCAIYPRYFKVSISTVIRAFAVGRPALVGDHGMMGEVVTRHSAGLTCNTESLASIRSMLEKAYDIFDKDKQAYDLMSHAGEGLAQSCELAEFKAVLRAAFANH